MTLYLQTIPTIVIVISCCDLGVRPCASRRTGDSLSELCAYNWL